MDVSSFLKWSEGDDKSTSRLSLQENISQFFDQGGKAEKTEKIEKNEVPVSTPASSSLFTDKLVERLISMAIPTTNELINSSKLDKRLSMAKNRPSLSVPIMSKNFIQLNSRLSIPFEFIDDVIRTFTWQNPTQTITILIFLSHTVLTPLPIIVSFPFFFILLNILVPNFTNLHKPDSEDPILGKNNPILSDGSNLCDVEFVKPAPEISREFIINLTDLQNHMLLYVKLWDFIDGIVKKFGYFVDDGISTFWSITLLSAGLFFLAFGETIVLRSVFLLKVLAILGIWGFSLTYHPNFHDYFYNLVYSEDMRYYFLGKTNKFENFIHDQIIEEIDEPQEQREVEIFEIQQFDSDSKEWHLVFYLSDNFTRYSKLRINYFELTPPIGSSSLSLVKPPNENWMFADDGWKIDLHPEQWVNTHLLFDFVHIDHETKWVYDKLDSDSNDDIQFRRRRWTRSAARTVGSNDANDTIRTSSSHSNLTGVIQY